MGESALKIWLGFVRDGSYMPARPGLVATRQFMFAHLAGRPAMSDGSTLLSLVLTCETNPSDP